MIKYSCKKLIACLLLLVSFTSIIVYAEGNAIGIVGKNGWLFVSHDISTSADIPTTDASLDLIRRFNRVLSNNGITMALVLIPMKMRVYGEFLPANVHLNNAMIGQYDYALKKLIPSVNVIDLKTPFMKDSNRNGGPFPLFLKLDSHWSPSGVFLAAETIKAGIEINPVLKKALDATPVDTYKLEIGKTKKTKNSHDLTSLLPPGDGQKIFPPEESLLFTVVRVPPKKSGDIPPVMLLGTSNSKPWTGFSDALNYTLQRDLLVDTTLGEKGNWYGAEIYLRSDAFQTKPPKLLIWEMEERDLRASPSYQFREARYRIDNTEWLLRVAALVQANCKPSSVNVKMNSVGLASNSANQKSGGIAAGLTTDTDFIELNFNNPIGKLDYLSARLSNSGSTSVILEASGSDVPTRQFTVPVPGDGIEHVFKYPLPSNGKGYTKVRILPGKTSGFSFQGLQVCHLPDDLLN